MKENNLITMVHGQQINEEYKSKPVAIVIQGCARLPENVKAKHGLGSLTIELQIDTVDSEIVDVCCVLLPFLEKKILRPVLLGKKINRGISDAIEQLEKVFFGITKKATIAALSDAYNRYRKAVEEKEQ